VHPFRPAPCTATDGEYHGCNVVDTWMDLSIDK
jgi:hypothetical protein